MLNHLPLLLALDSGTVDKCTPMLKECDSNFEANIF